MEECSNLVTAGLTWSSISFLQKARFHELVYKLSQYCYVNEDQIITLYSEHTLQEIRDINAEDQDWTKFYEELTGFGDYVETTWIEWGMDI